MKSLETAASRALSQSSETPPSDYEKAEYLSAARTLLGCFRTGDANDPEVYVAAAVRVLSSYPLDVVRRVVDPVTGLPSRSNWLPTVREIMSACEEIHGFNRRAAEREKLAQEQLAERARLDAERRARPTYEALVARCAKSGLDIGPKHRAGPLDQDAVRLKYGLSQAEWDAIPNAET